jgi:hypothetical protein
MNFRNALMATLVAALIVVPTVSSAQVVISAFYGGGGNTGAPFNADYVELANNASAPATLTSHTLQYGSPTGTTIAGNVALPSPLTIPAKSYYLVKVSATGANGIAVPFDFDGSTIAAGGAAGKIYLVNQTANITNLNPNGNAAVVDAIGYGTTANQREGAAVANNAPAPSNTQGIRRTVTSFLQVDTNDNASDFAVYTITTTGADAPRNSATTQFPVSISEFSAE